MLRWRFKRDLALGLSFLCLSAVAINSDNASAVDGDVQVEIGITPVIQVTLPQRVMINAKPGGPFAKAKMPITVKTNSLAGYSESISVNHYSDGEHDDYYKSLVNIYDSSYTISALADTVSSESYFPVDQWGCATGEDGRYRALSTADSPSIRYMTNNAHGEQTHDLICGARVSKTKAAGIYNNTILVNVVANVLPETIMSINYMQEVDDTVIASMETDHSYQLVDGRDQKIYWVTKMRDGNVWMTQNLDYDLAAAGVSVYDWSSDTSTNIYSHYRDGGDLYYDVDDGQMKNANALPINSEKLHYHIGSFYTLNNSAYTVSDLDDEDDYTEYSNICPFKWGIPAKNYIYGSYDGLKIAYNQGISDALYLAPMGYIESDGQMTGLGSSSYYFDRTRSASGNLINANSGYYYADVLRALNIDGNYLVSDVKMKNSYGGFIRCVTHPSYGFDVEYLDDLRVYSAVNYSNFVGNEWFYTFQNNITVDLKDINEFSDRVSIVDGYEFLGWTLDNRELTKPTVTSVSMYDYTDYTHTGDQFRSKYKQVYATWAHDYKGEVVPFTESYEDTRTIDDIEYMQDITPEIVSNTQPKASKQLIDSRDGKKYWVQKLADGNIWMEQNLDLDLTGGVTLTPENSNVDSERTIQTVDNPDGFTSENGASYIQHHLDDGKDLTSIADLDESDTAWKRAYGSQYNFYTISAGTMGDPNSEPRMVTESICPKGWIMPSGSRFSDAYIYDVYPAPSNDEYYVATLYTSYNNETRIALNTPYTDSMRSIHIIPGALNGGLMSFSDYYSHFFARCVAPKAKPTGKTLENITYMHEMTSDVCRNTTVGTEVLLTDARDNMKYFVGKLSDGNCWMLQNLNFDIVSYSGYYSSDSYNSLYLDDRLSDVHAYYDGINIYDITYSYCYRGPGCYKIDRQIRNGSNIIASFDNTPANSYFRKTVIGGLYDHKTATLGTDYYNEEIVKGSICPRGWRLPTRQDAMIPDELGARTMLKYSSYPSSGSSITTDYYYYWLADGYVEDSDNMRRPDWWYGYYMRSNGSTSNSVYDRLMPIRCLAR